jgi:uncharacterized membrane protein
MKDLLKNLEYGCMAVVFLMAGLSAYMFYGSGLDRWVWQVVLMMWIGHAFMFRRQIDKLRK